MKISVIVPVYNVELYLTKCLESIINQTYRDLEIILVNDGSSDNSGYICEEFKKRDDRVVVVHKKNGGLSSARNAGLEIAKGDLIGFIDSDDWIEPDYFELLYRGIEINNADISVTHLIKVKDFSKIDFTTKWEEKWSCFNTNEAMEELFSSNFIGYSAVNKLYRRNLFNEVNFPEGMLMEDKATIYKLIHKSEKVVVSPSQKYHYFLRENSIIRSKFNGKYFDSFKIHEDIIVFIDKKYPDLSILIRARYVYASIRMLLVMIRNNHDKKEDFQKCIEVIQGNTKYMISEKKMNISVKILSVLLCFIPIIPYLLSKSRLASKIISRLNIS